jgi:hypothetical protein
MLSFAMFNIIKRKTNECFEFFFFGKVKKEKKKKRKKKEWEMKNCCQTCSKFDLHQQVKVLYNSFGDQS